MISSRFLYRWSSKRVASAMLSICAWAGVGCGGTLNVDSAASCSKERFVRPHVEILEGAARKKVTIGGKTLIAEPCLLDAAAPEMKSAWFDEAIQSLNMAPDGGLIVLDHKNAVRRYVIQPGEGCRLALDTTFGKGGLLYFPTRNVESVSVLETGTILAKSFWSDTFRYKMGELSRAKCDVDAVIGRGKTGFLIGGSGLVIVDTAGTCERNDWPATGWGDENQRNVHFVRPWGEDVVLGMTVRGTQHVAIHGVDGTKKLDIGASWNDTSVHEDERICWARDADACGGKICVLDSNCRKLRIWNPQSGAFVGAVKIGELLGLDYPWPVDLAVGSSEAYIAVSHVEKATAGAKENRDDSHVGMIFRIKGLNQ